MTRYSGSFLTHALSDRIVPRMLPLFRPVIFRLFVLPVLLALLAGGCLWSGSRAAVAAGTGTGAGASKDLIILTSHDTDYMAPLVEHFEAANPGLRVTVLYKKTPAAAGHIAEGRDPVPDVFMASSADAFDGLAQAGRLLSLVPSSPPQYSRDVALSGFGVMWSPAGLAQAGLSPPQRWDDLLDPRFAGHLVITSPTRSGTMHVMVESLLQTRGWDRGWALLLELAGNVSTITARSFGVRDGILKGRFAMGLTVDFFAFSAEAQGHPAGFSYLDGLPLLPARAAIPRHAPHPDAARRFIDFLSSPDGQALLADPAIRRLPILPGAYRHFPPEFPNPFLAPERIPAGAFDPTLSSLRYHLVNALFDSMITFRHRPLVAAWKRVRQVDAVLAETPVSPAVRAEVTDRLNAARKALTQVPVGDSMAADPAMAAAFNRTSPGMAPSPLQARLEAEWAARGDRAITEALRVLREAEALLRPLPEIRHGR